MVRKEHQRAKGRQVITLNLAITMRVTLAGIFLKSFLTLYIYIIFEKLFSYKTGYRVPFKHDYFGIKKIVTCFICALYLNGILVGGGLLQDKCEKCI